MPRCPSRAASGGLHLAPSPVEPANVAQGAGDLRRSGSVHRPSRWLSVPLLLAEGARQLISSPCLEVAKFPVRATSDGRVRTPPRYGRSVPRGDAGGPAASPNVNWTPAEVGQGAGRTSGWSGSGPPPRWLVPRWLRGRPAAHPSLSHGCLPRLPQRAGDLRLGGSRTRASMMPRARSTAARAAGRSPKPV